LWSNYYRSLRVVDWCRREGRLHSVYDRTRLKGRERPLERHVERAERMLESAGSAEPARSDLRSRVIRLGLIPRTYVHRGGGAGPPRRVQLTSANAPPFPSRPVSPFPHTSDTRRRTSSRLPRTAGFRSSRQIPVFRRTGNGREKRRHMQTCFDVQSINGSVPTGRGRPASPRPPAPGVRSRERVY
jgi:hypothetical protein